MTIEPMSGNVNARITVLAFSVALAAAHWKWNHAMEVLTLHGCLDANLMPQCIATACVANVSRCKRTSVIAQMESHHFARPVCKRNLPSDLDGSCSCRAQPNLRLCLVGFQGRPVDKLSNFFFELGSPRMRGASTKRQLRKLRPCGS